MSRARPAAIALVALLLAACSGGPPGTSDAVAGSEGAVASFGPIGSVGSGGFEEPIQRFYPQTIVDPAAGGVAAMTFLAPEGWSYSGSIQWLPEWSRAAFLQTTLNDLSTGLTLDWLPIQDFIWFTPPQGLSVSIGGNYQGKMYVPPATDPAQFVADFWAPTTLPELQQAQLINVTEVPAIADEFLRGFGGPGNAGAYRLRYAYTDAGQAWEEDVNFALLVSATSEPTSWYVNFAYTVRGPAGALDASAGLISTVVASRATTPEWEATYRTVQQLFYQGIQQQMADTQAFGQLLAQHRAESQALQQQIVEERQASQDRIADLRGQTLQGVESYLDPVNGGFVQLPSTWSTYWVNQRGEFLTANAGFDPNSLNDGTWQMLTPRDR